MISGDVRKIPHASRIRHFAACCGTHLFFQASEEAEWFDVTIASLDDPVPFPPEISIWTEDRLPRVTLEEGRPAYPRGSVAAALDTAARNYFDHIISDIGLPDGTGSI